MKAIRNINTFEDWQEVSCKGEIEVTDLKLIVQFYRDSFTVIEASNAGIRGKKLNKFTIRSRENSKEFSYDLANFFHQESKFTISEVYELLQLLDWKSASYSSDERPIFLCDFGNENYAFSASLELVSGKDYRPSWWKPTGKQKLVVIEEGDVVAKIITNHSIKLERKDGSPEGARVFVIGDEVEQGSYNMTYTGEIIDIKEKYVTISGCPCGTENHKYSEFIRRNWNLDLEKIYRDNANWSD